MEGITEMVAQQPEQETPVCNFATVGAVYEDGVTLIFDGEAEAGEKHYKCNTSVVFAAGDRVKILPDSGTYVVEYVVGAPAQPDTPEEPDPVELAELTYRSGNVVRTVSLNASALAPKDSATQKNVTLGTSSLPWKDIIAAAANIDNFTAGHGAHQIGAAYSSLGFFGASPQTVKTVYTSSANQGYSAATSSNYLNVLNNVVGILKAYGLIKTI